MYYSQLVIYNGKVVIANIKMFDHPIGEIDSCEIDSTLIGLLVIPRTDILNIWDDGWVIKD